MSQNAFFGSEDNKKTALEEIFVEFLRAPDQFCQGPTSVTSSVLTNMLQKYDFSPRLVNLLALVAGDIEMKSKAKWWIDFLESVPVGFDLDLLEYRISEFRMIRLLCLLNVAPTSTDALTKTKMARVLERSYIYFSKPIKNSIEKQEILQTLTMLNTNITESFFHNSENLNNESFFDILMSAEHCFLQRHLDLLHASWSESRVKNVGLKSTQQLLLVSNHFYKEREAIHNACSELF